MSYRNYNDYEKNFYVKFDYDISKIATTKIPGMFKEIVPFTVKKATYFLEDLVLNFS